MSTPHLGEIRMFAGNFEPLGWAFCNGQLLAISENDALFALIGTTYGGDGEQTFALPDLRGRFALHQSFSLPIGSTFGQEAVTLTAQQLPSHTHAVQARQAPGDTYAPAGATWARDAAGGAQSHASGVPDVALKATALGPAGGNQPHENMPPFLGIHFIIALNGVFPSQS